MRKQTRPYCGGSPSAACAVRSHPGFLVPHERCGGGTLAMREPASPVNAYQLASPSEWPAIGLDASPSQRSVNRLNGKLACGCSAGSDGEGDGGGAAAETTLALASRGGGDGDSGGSGGGKYSGGSVGGGAGRIHWYTLSDERQCSSSKVTLSSDCGHSAWHQPSGGLGGGGGGTSPGGEGGGSEGEGDLGGATGASPESIPHGARIISR